MYRVTRVKALRHTCEGTALKLDTGLASVGVSVGVGVREFICVCVCVGVS